MPNYFAPIIIPTLCRYEHFVRCVESLKKCKYADQTDIYIGVDYPSKEEHWDGYKKILYYLEKLSGFKTINIIKREKNYGASPNFADLFEFVFQKYDRLIATEDDNEFSPNFLEYTNEGLEKFDTDPQIFAICGYNYPITMPPNFTDDFYFWKGFSAWGYATWRGKFQRYKRTYEEATGFLDNYTNVLNAKKYSDTYLPDILKIAKTKHLTGDTLVCVHLIKSNMYCIFPSISKVRNYGNDGSGLHCLMDGRFISQEIDKRQSFEYRKIENQENPDVNKVLRKYFHRDIFRRIYDYSKYISYRLKIY